MEGDANFVPVYDVNTGKKLKRYRPRKHPLKDWTEDEFRRRYRVTKQLAMDLIFDFIQWYPKDVTTLGGAIPLADRVSTPFSHLYPTKLFTIYVCCIFNPIMTVVHTT